MIVIFALFFIFSAELYWPERVLQAEERLPAKEGIEKQQSLQNDLQDESRLLPGALPFTGIKGAQLKKILRRRPQDTMKNPRCPEIERWFGQLLLGLNPQYQPLYIPKGLPDFPGIDVEIAQELSCALQVSYRWIAAPPTALLAAVHRGEIDLALGGISSNLKRARFVHFSDPYIITTAAGLLARSSLPPVSKSEDFPRREYRSIADLTTLAPLRIGIVKNTTNQALVQQRAEFQAHGKPFIFNEPVGLLQALLERRIDILITDGLYVQALLLKQPQLLNDFIPLTKVYREEHLSIALPQGDAEFLGQINFFIKEIKRTGVLKNIMDKYLKSDRWIPAK